MVWYDPTEVVTKPDPAHAAEKLYDSFELSGDAFRRAFGFADTDKPSESEIANRITINKATLPPEIVTALVKHLLPSVFKDAQQANVAGDGKKPPMPDSARELLYGDGDGGQQFSEPPEPPDASESEPTPASADEPYPGTETESGA